jgi:hypothetical protein
MIICDQLHTPALFWSNSHTAHVECNFGCMYFIYSRQFLLRLIIFLFWVWCTVYLLSSDLFSGRMCEHEGKSENLENCKVGNLRKVSGFRLRMALNSSELGTAHSEGPADPLLPDGHNNDHSTECLIYDQFINKN